MTQEPSNLEELIDQIDEIAKDRQQVTLNAVFEKIGRRSFGVFLLVPGVVTLAPIIGDIPGVPTIMASLVVLTAIQLLLQRGHFWLPKWLLTRSVARDKIFKALGWMRPPARFVDRFLRPRLPILVQDGGVYAIAVVCIVIAAATPAMELVPFSANGAGAALTSFGLSLTARDGLLALLAYIFSGITFTAVFYVLL